MIPYIYMLRGKSDIPGNTAKLSVIIYAQIKVILIDHSQKNGMYCYGSKSF